MRLRLTFPPALIQEPIIYRLVKDFDIVINIRRADVKETHGWVALEMEAEEGTLQRGVEVLPMEVNPATASLYIVNPLTGGGMSALFSTHPPIAARIERLVAFDANRGL